jgi:hypothetical protein
MDLTKLNWKLAFSYGFAAMIILAMGLAIKWFPSTSQESWLCLMILIGGISTGWVVGIVISPYTGEEKTKFGQYTKAVAAFLSGYVVAHLNDLIKYVMKPEFLRVPSHVFQMILLIASFCVALIVVYVTRQYAR